MKPDIHAFLDLVKTRTSCRNYTRQPVTEEEINYCLEAARLAPSACNQQPWRFVIVREEMLRLALCERALLPGVAMPWMKNAPIIIAICADRSVFTHQLAPLISGVNYHLLDIGIAGEHLALAATAQGLATCWIGWFKEKQVKKILQIPARIQVLSLMTLGHPAEPPEPRSRLERKDISRHNVWTAPN